MMASANETMVIERQTDDWFCVKHCQPQFWRCLWHKIAMLLLVIIEYQLVPGFAWFWSFDLARGKKLSLFWEMNYQSLENHKEN